MANRKLFSFTSRALPSDSFLVVRFTGREALSQLYAFDITLLALAETLDPAKMLAEPATFTLHGLDGDQPVHGRIAKFYALQRYGDFIMCRVVLMPRIVAATLTVHHRIFLDKSLPEFGAAALARAGLAAPTDFEFRCEQSYPSREYVCQYAESDFNFLSRWLERDGVYYFFEQGSDRERLVLTDTTMAHSALPHAPD
jgi:type VI secretion system secreted protein VgrG